MALYTRYSDNILTGAAVSAGASPMTGYTLTDLLRAQYPDLRVRFSTNTVTITFTVASATGAILLIPWHNLTPGSSSVLTLTNSAGLSQAITIPALMANGLPHPVAYNFSALANRTSTVWNLVISGNATNVQLGAGIAVYSTVRDFSSFAGGNINASFVERELHFQDEVSNEYGTNYVQDYGTHKRIVEFGAIGTFANVQDIVDWFRANHGRSYPSLLWPDPNNTTGTGSPIYGVWSKDFSVTRITPTRSSFRTTFEELSRGKVAGS